MLWNYEIKNSNEILEKGIGKSNSYTRNALNMLAWQVGCCAQALNDTTSFADGYINIKTTTGSLQTGGTIGRNSTASNDPIVYVGSGTGVESLDSYTLPTLTLTGGSNIVASVFDTTTRILTTTMSRPFFNGTGADINITEAALSILISTGTTTVLMVRDVFAPIVVANGLTMVWTYTTEVAFPNP
jgi:hypothetical protein